MYIVIQRRSKVRKIIGFKCEEELKAVTTTEIHHIKNGFGNVILSCPPLILRRLIANDFDAKKLGQAFIDLGMELMKEKNKITNITLRSQFVNQLSKMGKELNVSLEYDTIEEER